MFKIFKYFLIGGRTNFETCKFLQNNEDVRQFIVDRNYALDLSSFFELRDLVLNSLIQRGIISNSDDLLEDVNSIHSGFGYWWLKSMIKSSLGIKIVVIDYQFDPTKTFKK